MAVAATLNCTVHATSTRRSARAEVENADPRPAYRPEERRIGDSRGTWAVYARGSGVVTFQVVCGIAHGYHPGRLSLEVVLTTGVDAEEAVAEARNETTRCPSPSPSPSPNQNQNRRQMTSQSRNRNQTIPPQEEHGVVP